MADDDNFDIDIYGDDAAPEYQDNSLQGGANQEDASAMHTDSHAQDNANAMDQTKSEPTESAVKQEPSHGENTNGDQLQQNSTQQIASTGGANMGPLPKQAPQQQGMKRKQGDQDDRPTDPGATAALMINDLNWWISEEDIRGWANQSGCEDELIEITFNEHKVNGKSKGQVYVQLQTPQAATAFKHQLDSVYKDQAHAKKPSAVFNPPHINPFKTLPKDAPVRDKNRGDRPQTAHYGGNQGNTGGNYNRFNNRGNFNSNRGNAGFQNRNFSSPVNAGMGGPMGGFGGPNPMNNFGGPMGGMNNFGGGFNRGGMMGGGGMRGGMGNRGGRGGNMGGMNAMPNAMAGGMGMPMGGMGMGMMGPGMGMGGNMGMMGGMGAPGGFAGNQAHFNPAFFNQQNQAPAEGNWNPHGAKRPRPE